MATRVERNTIITDRPFREENDGGAGLLVALILLLIAGVMFWVWTNRGTGQQPQITRNVTVNLPDVNVPATPAPAPAQQ